ncbi:ribosome 60S biogenesis N-terminal-domain-containing protein [Bisporella sp. PMI_857]|nr:ribosome 60S biogenesis N-terminal-domain-containing protein [Bisporella sp. PMI_857]
MSKRFAEDSRDGDQAYLKRQKISFASNVQTPNPAEDIRSARKLSQLLAFDQDVPRSRHAIQSFKVFLESIANVENDTTPKVAILKEFLESQIPAEGDESAVYLGDLVRTWSFASQSNTDVLLSAVPSIFALLLKALSNILDLKDYGLRIGRMLLQKPQQELISRGLTASKAKEFIISPALRLLREIVTFDCGSLAKHVFRTRDETFKGLSRDLGIKNSGDGAEDRKKPSVRTNALRLILSLLKFLPLESKRELLNQRDIVNALIRNIREDPPFLIREILEGLTNSVLKDELLPRDAKTKVVNANSLARIAMLYRYHQPDEELEDNPVTKSVDEAAHNFLVLACTSPNIGILNRQAGYYPRGVDPDEIHNAGVEERFIDLGIDNIEWMDKFAETVPVRNTILSEFVQELRPWSNMQQSDLLLAIFKSAPELIAGYFIGKRDFSFEPKLTATWIGYAALIFSTLQLPIPEYFGHPKQYARLPPPTSIVLENILPQALSQKVLTRCLSHSNNLVTFFVVRLLCVSLIKLRDTLKMYHEADPGSRNIWAQSADRLVSEICQRYPSIKDVISSFRNISKTDLMQREAITKLLVLYYEVIPRVALDAKFDVSAVLSEVLLTMDETTNTHQDRVMRFMELANLFQFAHLSPGMRWFTKAGGLTISPFMAMLKLLAGAPPGFPLLKLRSVIESVVTEHQIFQSKTSLSALHTFIIRLRELRGDNAGIVWEFLDDCVSRCAANPVKYIFALEELQSDAHKSGDGNLPVSLVTLAMAEQWLFLQKNVEREVLKDVADFLTAHLAGSLQIKEDKKVLKRAIQNLISNTEDSSIRVILEHTRKLVDNISVAHLDKEGSKILELNEKSHTVSKPEDIILEDLLGSPEVEKEDNNALTRWAMKEVDEVIEAGHASALVKLLSSKHLSVRKEAVTNISKFSAKLKESSYEEKEQIWLLLAEVVETAKKLVDQEPIPNIISSFASSAIAVVNDPLHCLYPKINKFLSQGPAWDVDKVPLMYKILDEAPSLDDAHYLEIAWLLNYMTDGLQTPADMSIFRKRRVFEKLFSLYNNPYLAPGLRDKILRILYKATTIEGGSTTLITRFSSVTWLQAQAALIDGTTLKALLQKILESSDQKRIQGWSKQSATELETLVTI